MARLIDADALYRDVSQRAAYTDDLGTKLAVIFLQDAIAHAPRIDAIPVEWMKRKHEENSPDPEKEDYDYFLWETTEYVLTAWNDEQGAG